MPKNKSKKVVQELKGDRLRKVRYELRTLLRLEKEKRWRDLQRKFVALGEDKSLSYNERWEKRGFIIKRQEKIDLNYARYPLCCGVCGVRVENLVHNPMKSQWLCVFCYETAHERFPEEYP